MKHEEILDRLSEYIDDELSAADKELVERHLAGCPKCVETLAALKAVTGMIAGAPRVDMPAGAADRLAAAIDERVMQGPPRAHKKPPMTWRRWATHSAFLSVAGAAAVLVIAVAVWKSPPPSSSPSLLRSPTMSAPEATGEPESFGAAQPQAAGPGAAARQTVDAQLNEAAAGTLLKKSSSPQGAAEDRSSESTKLLNDRYADSGNIPVDKAASLAGGGHPVRLQYSAAGAWEQDVAWIVIVERTDKPGYFIGAVVRQKDGQILYIRSKQRR